jgi:ammonia channel protein AmtB
VRKKNVLSVIMQCLFLMCLMTLIWATYGYSLSFGGSGAYIGNGDYLFMKGVQRSWDPFWLYPRRLESYERVAQSCFPGRSYSYRVQLCIYSSFISF